MTFKDGVCPVCGGDTHGINNEPMRCELCGWVQDGAEAKQDAERIDQIFREEFPEEG
jgi:rubredoxin